MIQSDLGASFTNEVTVPFLDKFEIRVVHSSVSHRQSNAEERVQGILKRVLKALCAESGSLVKNTIISALFALRTVSHENEGLSPLELMMARNFRTPQTLIYEWWVDRGKIRKVSITRVERCEKAFA
ncbi:retrovirus-related Pol polyprotein from transposon 17.6 [Trichonephila clavipes]|nr:retrovirus-related Pol polyprotein from transposon 17.6 [Trichonephila clavipes]